jgi:hypothetical protein
MDDEHRVIRINEVHDLNDSVALAAADHQPFPLPVLLGIGTAGAKDDPLCFGWRDTVLRNLLTVPFGPAKFPKHEVYYINNIRRVKLGGTNG